MKIALVFFFPLLFKLPMFLQSTIIICVFLFVIFDNLVWFLFLNKICEKLESGMEQYFILVTPAFLKRMNLQVSHNFFLCLSYLYLPYNWQYYIIRQRFMSIFLL